MSSSTVFLVAACCIYLTRTLSAIETDVIYNLDVDSSKPVLGDLPVPAQSNCTLKEDRTGATCKELYDKGATKSGLYIVEPGIRAYCSMGLLDSGWMVIMRRTKSSTEFSQKSYQDFIDGFGDFSNNFCIGLETIHCLTSTRTYELYIGMEYPKVSGEGNVRFIFARYSRFSVGDMKSGYKLSLGAYVSHVPDKPGWIAGGDALGYHNGAKFSARGSPDQYCGVKYGGWWYKRCDRSLFQGCNYMKWATLDNRGLQSFVMAIREVTV